MCVLFGCSVPVVLGELDEDDGDGFEFMRDMYVYGKVDGDTIMALTEE